VLVSSVVFFPLQICRIVGSIYRRLKTKGPELSTWAAVISGFATCVSIAFLVASYLTDLGRPSQIILMILPSSVGELFLNVLQILPKHTRRSHSPTLNSETGTQENLDAGIIGKCRSEPSIAPEHPDGRTNSTRSSFDVEDGLPRSLVALTDLEV